MLPAIVVKDDSLARGIETAGSALGKALGERAKEKRTRDLYTQSGSILQSLIQDLPENPSISDLQGIYSKAIQSNVPPEIIKMYADMYMPNIKARAQGQASTELMNQFGLGTPEKSLKSPEEQTAQQIAGFQPTALQRSLPFYQEPEVKQTPIQQIKQVQKQAEVQSKTPTKGEEPPPYELPQLSDRQLMATSILGGKQGAQAAKMALALRSEGRRQFEKNRDWHSARLKETEKKIKGLRETLPKKALALKMANDAIASGEIGAFSLSNLAQRLNIPELQTAKGSQLVTSSKEQFLSNMSRVSAKGQNQFFEQRLLDMLPKIGQSKEANDTVQAILEGEYEMDKDYLDTYSQLEANDMKKEGMVISDIESRVDKILEDKRQKTFDKTNYKLRTIYEREKGANWINENLKKKVPDGTILTKKTMKALYNVYGDYKKVIENAKKLGYTIPTQQQAIDWNMSAEE